MDDDVRFWLFVGFILMVFAWVLAMTSCIQTRPTSEPMVELQRTPTDTIFVTSRIRSE